MLWSDLVYWMRTHAWTTIVSVISLILWVWVLYVSIAAWDSTGKTQLAFGTGLFVYLILQTLSIENMRQYAPETDEYKTWRNWAIVIFIAMFTILGIMGYTILSFNGIDPSAGTK